MSARGVVRLVPMSQEAFTTWRAKLIPGYAAENVASGRWTADEALAQSERQINELLPGGVGSPNQFLWSTVDERGDAAGTLWVGTERRPDHAFIYDIELDESRRGQGLGTAALGALEDWARAHGITTIGLHVFGRNRGAWRLYQRLGYVETNINMEKQL